MILGDKLLDPNVPGTKAKTMSALLRMMVIGQTEAIDAIVDAYEKFMVGLNDTTRTAGNLLFLGPTGVGKTRVVEAFAEVLTGFRDGFMKINGGEFSNGHEVASLIGPPPGYLGFDSTAARFTQANLDKHTMGTSMPSILLVDELEKAHEKLHDMLLGILDKGELMNTKGELVKFHKTVVIMTSNLGAGEIAAMMDGGMGYRAQQSVPTPERMRAAAMRRYTKETRPEFQNRIDKVVVFKNLTSDDLEKVLSVEVSLVQQRVFHSKEPFFFHVMTPARKALLEEGFSTKYGARELKRVLDRRIVTPLARLLSSGQITSGNHIAVHYVDGDFRFINEDIPYDSKGRVNSSQQQYRN